MKYQLEEDQVGELMNLIEVMGAEVEGRIEVHQGVEEEVGDLIVVMEVMGEEVGELKAAIVIVVMEVGAGEQLFEPALVEGEEQLFGTALVEVAVAHPAEDLKDLAEEDLAEDPFLKEASPHEKVEEEEDHHEKPAVAAVVEGRLYAMEP